jgi:hypothetical protein
MPHQRSHLSAGHAEVASIPPHELILSPRLPRLQDREAQALVTQEVTTVLDPNRTQCDYPRPLTALTCGNQTLRDRLRRIWSAWQCMACRRLGGLRRAKAALVIASSPHCQSANAGGQAGDDALEPICHRRAEGQSRSPTDQSSSPSPPFSSNGEASPGGQDGKVLRSGHPLTHRQQCSELIPHPWHRLSGARRPDFPAVTLAPADLGTGCSA